jgi:hypothetical protein
MLDYIYDKSEKGRQEIRTRKHHLAPKSRAMLVLIDGKHSGKELLKSFAFLGMTEVILSELAENGFVDSKLPVANDVVAANDATAPESQDSATSPADTQGAADGILAHGETQYNAIYHFYNHTIKSALGFWGIGLTLKVERCSSIEDFRALRLPYLEAVFKAQGEEMTLSLRGRLDQLLYLGETPPPLTSPHFE